MINELKDKEEIINNNTNILVNKSILLSEHEAKYNNKNDITINLQNKITELCIK